MLRVLAETLVAGGQVARRRLHCVRMPKREHEQPRQRDRDAAAHDTRHQPVGETGLREQPHREKQHGERHGLLEGGPRRDRPERRHEGEHAEPERSHEHRRRQSQRPAFAGYDDGREREQQEEQRPAGRLRGLLHARDGARAAREREDRGREHDWEKLFEPNAAWHCRTRIVSAPHRQHRGSTGAGLYSPPVPYLAAAAVLAAVYGTGNALTAGGRIGIEDGVRRRLTVFFDRLRRPRDDVLRARRRRRLRPYLAPRTDDRRRGARRCPSSRQRRAALASAWRRSGRERWLLVAAGAIVAFDAFLASAPPTSGDATAYHLAAPRDWLAAGHFFPIWWDLGAFQPFSVEMHFALARAIGGGGGAILFGALLGGFSAVCIYAARA